MRNPGKRISSTFQYELSEHNMLSNKVQQVQIAVDASGYRLASFDSCILANYKLTLEGYIPKGQLQEIIDVLEQFKIDAGIAQG